MREGLTRHPGVGVSHTDHAAYVHTAYVPRHWPCVKQRVLHMHWCPLQPSTFQHSEYRLPLPSLPDVAAFTMKQKKVAHMTSNRYTDSMESIKSRRLWRY
ncbi:MAG: hypothetical protein OXI37_01160 [Gammaproteobacteria bacterium]|nr:hypothetical protein [Gammaproteobacteria bacterium]